MNNSKGRVEVEFSFVIYKILEDLEPLVSPSLPCSWLLLFFFFLTCSAIWPSGKTSICSALLYVCVCVIYLWMHSIPEMLLEINNRGDREELLKLHSSNIFRLQQQLQQEHFFFVKNKMLWDFNFLICFILSSSGKHLR